jgi:hypothetical protein
MTASHGRLRRLRAGFPRVRTAVRKAATHQHQGVPRGDFLGADVPDVGISCVDAPGVVVSDVVCSRADHSDADHSDADHAGVHHRGADHPGAHRPCRNRPACIRGHPAGRCVPIDAARRKPQPARLGRLPVDRRGARVPARHPSRQRRGQRSGVHARPLQALGLPSAPPPVRRGAHVLRRQGQARPSSSRRPRRSRRQSRRRGH